MAKKRRPIIEFSFDDGTIYDLVAVELMLEYGFTGTFYIPNATQLPASTIKSMSDNGMKIGGHTVSHPEDMKELSDEKQFQEIKDNKEWLEKITGKKVRSFAYPAGRFNHTTIRMLKKAGITNARRTGWGNIKKPYDKFRACPTVFVHPDRNKFGGLTWDEFAKQMYSADGAQYHHVWAHPQEVERFGMWQEFENYLLWLSQQL